MNPPITWQEYHAAAQDGSIAASLCKNERDRIATYEGAFLAEKCAFDRLPKSLTRTRRIIGYSALCLMLKAHYFNECLEFGKELLEHEFIEVSKLRDDTVNVMTIARAEELKLAESAT